MPQQLLPALQVRTFIRTKKPVCPLPRHRLTERRDGLRPAGGGSVKSARHLAKLDRDNPCRLEVLRHTAVMRSVPCPDLFRGALHHRLHVLKPRGSRNTCAIRNTCVKKPQLITVAGSAQGSLLFGEIAHQLREQSPHLVVACVITVAGSALGKMLCDGSDRRNVKQSPHLVVARVITVLGSAQGSLLSGEIAHHNVEHSPPRLLADVHYRNHAKKNPLGAVRRCGDSSTVNGHRILCTGAVPQQLLPALQLRTFTRTKELICPFPCDRLTGGRDGLRPAGGGSVKSARHLAKRDRSNACHLEVFWHSAVMRSVPCSGLFCGALHHRLHVPKPRGSGNTVTKRTADAKMHQLITVIGSAPGSLLFREIAHHNVEQNPHRLLVHVHYRNHAKKPSGGRHTRRCAAST
eukprot:CAMPEP_0204508060 /NCGR_PEP_ID=MMETSP0471-20130131/110076_1 /ASSEMBLY_ACC=CAM_ASM_000602 /TAXON_ID=2969 /ORGANISM="Oxyrrhis marina" /LENGTH=405 /DNA_ID=CAMNT_0051513095 /DNA_START=1577 /DNA_END=2790 /DNA_ORIENTATION=-